MDNICCGIIDLASRVCNITSGLLGGKRPKSPREQRPRTLMRLNVLRELQQPLGAISTYDVAESVLRLADVRLQALTGLLRLLRTDRGLLVSLAGTALMREECARCLKEVKCEVRIDFEEEYIPVTDPRTGARVRVSDLDVFRIGPDFVMDLAEGLRQYVLMAEPAKPLCKSACAGLCHTCGADLNAGPCGCPPPYDERWGALAGLKNDREGS